MSVLPLRNKKQHCYPSKLKFIALLLVMFLQACSESSEQAAFRASLIDKALNDENAKIGAAFLAQNSQREAVVTMASGMQYLVLQSGTTGEVATMQDSVEVHYRGQLVTGEVFDSSIERGKTSIFPLKSVIPGWRQALLKMQVGDKWEIYLPAKLAYGSRSPSQLIAANSALIYEIKLLAIIGDKRAQKADN